MATATSARTGRGRRAAVWAGLAAGTALAIWVMLHGIRIPGLPVVASVLATWAITVAATGTAAELLRRHHRALAGHAARGGKRGALAAGRGVRTGATWAASSLAARTRSAAGHLASRAESRWQARQPEPPVLTTTGTAETGQVPTRRVDGQPETDADRRFSDLRESGCTGPIDQDGNIPDPSSPKTASQQGGSTLMTETPGPVPAAPRAMPRARTRTGLDPAWTALVAATSDFEPEDDAALLAWMAGQVAGMSAYAEALADVYETCVDTVGLDPAAMAAMHDVADAAADDAGAMADARAKFAAHYAEVREFAASGGLLPYDGRWITGDGDA